MADQGNKMKQDTNFLTKEISYLTQNKVSKEFVPGTMVQIFSKFWIVEHIEYKGKISDWSKFC